MKEAIGNFLCTIGRALGATCFDELEEDELEEDEFDEDEFTLIPYNTIDINTMSSILLDKLEELNSQGEIYLPDNVCKTYRKEEVKNYYGLDEISKLTYIEEEHDCDDFAAMLFADFAGLVWTNTHSLNWFIDEKENFWFIEPQTGKLSKVIEGWQGTDIRFFLGR